MSCQEGSVQQRCGDASLEGTGGSISGALFLLWLKASRAAILASQPIPQYPRLYTIMEFQDASIVKC